MRRVGLKIVIVLIFCFSAMIVNGQKENISLKAQIMSRSLKAINFSENYFKRIVKNPSRKNAIQPKKISNKLTIVEDSVDGFTITTVYGEKPANKHVILLHGGAYMLKAMKGHRYIMEKFAIDYNYKVTIIDYPLAPENQADFTLEIVETAYRKIIETHANDSIFLFGDSAGGGLALALMQRLVLQNAKVMPQKTALMSPWVDVSMSNPLIDEFAIGDVMLDKGGLIKCGKLYAGNLDVKDPMVSPLFGNMAKLSDIKIWVSDKEMLYPDCIRLHKKINKAPGSKSALQIKKALMHDWVVLPIKERDHTLSSVHDFFSH